MYKFNRDHQFKLTDFNMPAGLKLNRENRWIRQAELIPWDDIEERYAELFPGKTGMPAKPLRMALGSLLIQKKLNCSDRELVEEITENPYLQYFVGLPGFQYEAPFVPSLLVEFRKRLNDEVLVEINEMIIDYNRPDDPEPPSESNSDTDAEEYVQGTLILDATCAPQNISYPQDTNLLNEAREDLEDMIDCICTNNKLPRPRMYRKTARKDYLNFAKSKKRTAKRIRRAIRQQLGYVRRDIRYLREMINNGYLLTKVQQKQFEVIEKVYEQQKYMFERHIHTVEDRIVSISQPYIRPIVRGKAAAPVEFGAKLDLSLDDRGMARIENLSFNAYNESEILIPAAENYRTRTGHYPERILADKIYRNRLNLQYCKAHGIRLSGPALGRPRKEAKTDRVLEYKDNADRIAVERAFALAKHSYGLGKIMTKLDLTTRSSIMLSVIAMNISRIAVVLLRQIYYSMILWCKQREIMLLIFQNNLSVKMAGC